jgi:hypothetical protein
MFRNSIRDRSAPAAIRRGTTVSEGSSSAVISTTFPGSGASVSRNVPRVVSAANIAVSCDLPCPGAPARTVTLPIGSHGRSRNRTGLIATSDAFVKTAVRSLLFLAAGFGDGGATSAICKPSANTIGSRSRQSSQNTRASPSAPIMHVAPRPCAGSTGHAKRKPHTSPLGSSPARSAAANTTAQGSSASALIGSPRGRASP